VSFTLGRDLYSLWFDEQDTESNEHSRQREEVTRSDFEGEGPEELVKLRDENQVRINRCNEY